MSVFTKIWLGAYLLGLLTGGVIAFGFIWVYWPERRGNK